MKSVIFSSYLRNGAKKVCTTSFISNLKLNFICLEFSAFLSFSCCKSVIKYKHSK